MRSAHVIALWFAILSAATRTLQAAELAPEASVRAAYAILERSLTKSAHKAAAPFRTPHRQKLMTQALSELFARDETYMEEAGEMGNLGADPFLSGQDGEIKNLRVSVTGKPADGRAEVTAAFRSFGQPVSVRFRMVEEAGSWRIDDIVNRIEGKDYSVREQLSQPYECGSFMKKPCKR